MNKEKLRYAILKEIEKGNRSFSHADFGVEDAVFHDQIRYLDREGLITGVFYADDIPYSLIGVEITSAGEDYLKQHNAWAKAYRGLKEIRDWLKF